MQVITSISRLTQWRKHLLPPMLSVIYLTALSPKFDLFIWIEQPCLFFVSMFCTAAFGYWVNDLFDIKIDKAANKKNFLSEKSITFKIWGLIFFSVVGIISWVLLNSSFEATLLFILFYVFLILYSIPPFRFKNNPILGPISDIHYGHVLPVFVPLILFYKDLIYLFPAFLVSLYFLCFMKGSRNILLHQLVDRKGDSKSGIKTFPLKFKSVFTLNLINRIILPIELILILCILIYFWPRTNIITYGFVGYTIFYFLNFSAWKLPFIPYRQLKFKFLFVLNDFYELWLPYLCLWTSNLSLKQKIVLTIIHSIIFIFTFKKIGKELKKIAANLGFVKAI